MSAVVQHYTQALAQRGFSPDPGQTPGLEALSRCDQDWRHYKSRRGGRLAKAFIHPVLPKGVYLWGGVGRGKSFLMDCFFAVVPIERKLRIHFHEFMRATHRELHELRGTENPLEEVALRVARRYRLICFDEFHISDIADAMILERLLSALIAARVGFVMTSNYHPDQLYPDGLHRDRLLPAIEMIKQHLEVVELGHQQDYRQIAGQAQPGSSSRSDQPSPVYLCPNGPEAEARLESLFLSLADGPVVQEPKLVIEARQIPALKQAGGVIWFGFDVLCGGPRSQNDYLELAARFHTVILSHVPQMSAGQSSEARRFTWLVDILYDHHVRLDLSAAVEPEALYREGQLANEFVRTASRLTEMRTEAFLSRQRRETVTSWNAQVR